MSARLPVLILHTGDPAPGILARFGSYAEQLRQAAGLDAGDVEIARVFEDVQPRTPQAYRAVLVTGSPADVTDRAPWGERTGQWLRAAIEAGLPAFGICYGHQLMADVLGGKVDFNPKGREVGTQALRLTPAAASDPMTAGLPETFPAQMQHSQTVLAPPPGATVLAVSDMDGCQMLRLGERAVSVQFHPEFSAELSLADLDINRDRYARLDIDAAAQAARVRPSPEAGSLVRRFLSLYAA